MPFLVIEAPTLTVDQPAEGATFENGAIPVAGKATNADFGRGQRGLGRLVRTGARPPAKPTPAPPPTPGPGDRHGRRGRRVQHAARAHGRPLGDHRHGLAARRARPTSLTRNVTVAYKGVNLVVTIKGGRAWIKVWVDGKIDPKIGAAGKVIANGKTADLHRQGVDRGPDRARRA